MTSYLDYIDSDPYDYYATQLQAGPVHRCRDPTSR